MHKKTNSKIMLFFTGLIFFTFFSSLACADGGMWIRNVDYWMEMPEENQMSIITYEDGIEDLTIAVRVRNSSLSSDEVVWIFPVPAEYDNVEIDVVKDIPFLDGRHVENEASGLLSNSLLFMLSSQLYLSPVAFLYYSGGMLGASSDVNVYEHLEKMGLTTEIVGTTNSTAFSEYLAEKNLTLGDEAMSIIEEYVDEKYSFVVSWVSDIQEFKNNAILNQGYYNYYGDPFFMLGISISFPTDKMYYPMKLTSIYDQKYIPILIQVHGFASCDQNLLDKTHTSYLIDDGIEYTEFSITEKAEEYTEDFWFDTDNVPSNIFVASFIASYGLFFIIFIFASISCISSVISGSIVYRKQKPILSKFASLGLFNFAGFFGMFISSFVLKIDENFVEKPIKKNKKISKDIEKTYNIIWGLIAVLIVILPVALYVADPTILGFMLFVTIILFGPIFFAIMLIFGLIKDMRKTAFILLFSLVFLILSLVIMIPLFMFA